MSSREQTRNGLDLVAQISNECGAPRTDAILSEFEIKDEDVLGIDHPDKSASKSRFGFEKAIKILG